MKSILTTLCAMLVVVVMTADGNPLEMSEEDRTTNEHVNYHIQTRKHRVKRALGDCFDESKWSDTYPYNAIITDKLPEEIDWTNSLPPVKNQGSCGSCWAFAAVGAIEKQSKRKPLSEQCLVDCSEENKGCINGNPKRAFDFVKKKGIAAEDTYPYTAKKETCNNYTTVTSIKGYYTINTDDELKHAVATVGPVAVGIQVDRNDFNQQVKDGIVKTCTGPVNHAVLVVGYTTVDNTKVWKIRNSWGEAWGNNGYFYLTREVTNACSVSRYGAVPIVSVASVNTPLYHSCLFFLIFVAVVLK